MMEDATLLLCRSLSMSLLERGFGPSRFVARLDDAEMEWLLLPNDSVRFKIRPGRHLLRVKRVVRFGTGGSHRCWITVGDDKTSQFESKPLPKVAVRPPIDEYEVSEGGTLPLACGLAVVESTGSPARVIRIWPDEPRLDFGALDL